MTLEKTTKQIILIVSALVLATTTTICIAKRDSIANLFKPKIKQENLIKTPDETSDDSSNEIQKEKSVSPEKECKKTQELIQEKKSSKSENETQKEKSVALKEEYKQICEECNKTQELLQEARALKAKAYDDLCRAIPKNAIMLSNMPKKSPEERAAYIKKEDEITRILVDISTTHDEAIHICLSLEESLSIKNKRLEEIEKILDEISPGWDNDLN